MLWAIIVVLLILAVLGAPHWGYWGGANYGYWPSGGIGLVVVVLIVLLLMGRI